MNFIDGFVAFCINDRWIRKRLCLIWPRKISIVFRENNLLRWKVAANPLLVSQRNRCCSVLRDIKMYYRRDDIMTNYVSSKLIDFAARTNTGLTYLCEQLQGSLAHRTANFSAGAAHLTVSLFWCDPIFRRVRKFTSGTGVRFVDGGLCISFLSVINCCESQLTQLHFHCWSFLHLNCELPHCILIDVNH